MARPGPKYKYDKKLVEKEAELLEKFAERCETIPFLEGFMRERGYPVEYVSRWAKRNRRMRQAVEKLKEIQRHKLLLLALANKINTGMAIFILKNNHGWSDKQELKHSGEIGGQAVPKIVIIRPKAKDESRDTNAREAIRN